MKKILLTVIFLLALVTYSFTQGKVGVKSVGIDIKGDHDTGSISTPSGEYNGIKNVFGTSSLGKNKPSNVFTVETIDMSSLQEDNFHSNVSYLKVKSREVPLSISMSNISDLINNSISDKDLAYKILDFQNNHEVMHIDDIRDFHIVNIAKDDLGITHVKMNQYFNGLLVYGGQLYVHFTRSSGVKIPTAFINGNWINVTEHTGSIKGLEENKVIGNLFEISKKDAIRKVRESFRNNKIQIRDLSKFAKYLVDNEQWQVNKVFFPVKKDGKTNLRPAYVVNVIADPIHRYRYVIDANNGDNLLKHDLYCSFFDEKECVPPTGSVVAHGKDLNGVNREFHAYENGGNYYLLDISRSMYDAGKSKLPDEPVGAIWTIDANNTHPNNADFNTKLNHVFSSNNSWGSRTSVSAHFNAGYAYDYYKNVHNRNSIDGKGGSIVSIINVSDEDGSSMGNAFWGGKAMYYGNGNNLFSSPLAKALDVSGHELTHGVIQNTADLEYFDESGAINESFADVFGAMMDRDDWKMGEEVVSNSFTSGALRDLSNPHNGGNNLNDLGYQPAHTSEQYKGEQDNNGVHINSGIPNFAFYKFAKKVGKDKAEKVYYRALTYYLTKSSKFVDLRIAIEKAAKDLYGEQEKNFAAQAFEAVGIGGGTGSGSGSDNQKDLTKNPGNDYVLVTGEQGEALYLFDGSGEILRNPLLNTPAGIKSKPSISDDAQIIVYVGNDKKIHLVTEWKTNNVKDDIIQDQPIWRNVIISKDGSLIAALTDEIDSKINIYSTQLKTWKAFQLKNPTSAQGVELGNVNFADAMEFDYSGEWVMYDCENEVGDNIKYWDIGFIKVWDNNVNNFGEGRTNKLFSGLSNDISIGNPTFSKISPYIIAFDYIEGDKYYCLGANIQTGKASLIYENTALNYPSFSNDDKKVLFEYTDNTSKKYVGVVEVDNTKILAVSGTEKFFSNYYEIKWPIWFSDGNRKLSTAVNEIPKGFAKKTKVYPVPVTQGVLNIESRDFKNKTNISIYNMLGANVLNENVDFKTKKLSFNISSLIQGNYVIKLNDGEKYFVDKFTVIK